MEIEAAVTLSSYRGPDLSPLPQTVDDPDNPNIGWLRANKTLHEQEVQVNPYEDEHGPLLRKWGGGEGRVANSRWLGVDVNVSSRVRCLSHPDLHTPLLWGAGNLVRPVLILKKKLFFENNNDDLDDDTMLHLLYRQCQQSVVQNQLPVCGCVLACVCMCVRVCVWVCVLS